MTKASLIFVFLFISSFANAQISYWPPIGIPVPDGAAGGIPYYISATELGALGAGTAGQCLVSGGSGAPTWAACSSGGGITSLNGQTAATQVFASDTNVGITSSNNTHTLAWSSTLSVSRGGTSAALSPALGNIVYTDASKLALLVAGTSGQVLKSNGAAAPSWASDTTGGGITSLNSQTGVTQVFSNDTNFTITSSNDTHTLGWASTLSFARGGSGASLIASNGAIPYSTGSALALLAAGTSGQFLQSSGAGAPTWAAAAAGGITSLNAQTGATQIFSNDTNVIVTSSNNTHAVGWSGTLALTRGGTGASVTAATGGIVYGASTSAMAMTVAGTSGQILTSGGAGAPTWTTAASGITSLGSQTGATQVFASDTNLTITSSNNTHTLGWLSILSPARGGSGSPLVPALGNIVYTDASKMVLLSAGTSGQALTSAGAAAPTWGGPYLARSGGTMTGIISMSGATIDMNGNAINMGGGAIATTGSITPQDSASANNGSSSRYWANTYSANYYMFGTVLGGIVYTDANKFNILAAGTSGQVLTSGGAAAPTWAAASSGITSLGSQTGATQVFASDTNLTITSSNNTHTLGWLSILSAARGGTAAALTPALGNIVYTDASKMVLLAAGTSGQVLTSGGAAAPTWAAPGGGSSITTAITSKTANYTIAAGDYTVLASAATVSFTITLPTASGNTGRIVDIKKIDSTSNAVYVLPVSGAFLDGSSASNAIISPNMSLTIQSDGSNWWIL